MRAFDTFSLNPTVGEFDTVYDNEQSIDPVYRRKRLGGRAAGADGNDDILAKVAKAVKEAAAEAAKATKAHSSSSPTSSSSSTTTSEEAAAKKKAGAALIDNAGAVAMASHAAALTAHHSDKNSMMSAQMGPGEVTEKQKKLLNAKSLVPQSEVSAVAKREHVGMSVERALSLTHCHSFKDSLLIAF